MTFKTLRQGKREMEDTYHPLSASAQEWHMSIRPMISGQRQSRGPNLAAKQAKKCTVGGHGNLMNACYHSWLKKGSAWLQNQGEPAFQLPFPSVKGLEDKDSRVH